MDGALAGEHSRYEQTLARCYAAQQHAQQALDRATMALRTAEERLRRAQAAQAASQLAWQRLKELGYGRGDGQRPWSDEGLLETGDADGVETLISVSRELVP